MKIVRGLLCVWLVLPCLTGVVIAQDSESAQAVQRAHDELLRWLGTGQSSSGWRQYLMSRDLQEQLKLGDKADRKIVRRILTAYSSKVAGLDMPNFAAVRRALRAWLDELRVPTVETLPDAALEAKEDFAPVSEQSLQQAKTALQQATGALEKYLGQGAAGDGWRKILKTADLRAGLKEAEPDVEVLEEVRKRFSREYRGLEQAEFTAVRDALTAYLKRLRIASDPEAENAYKQQLDILAESLRAHRSSHKPSDLEKAAASLAWLEDRGLASHITKVAREGYWKPNLFIEIDDQVVTYGFRERMDETNPINESRSGARVVGNGRTIGQMAPRLVPFDQVGIIYNEFEGITYSRTTAYASQATVFSRGETHLRAIKQLSIGRRGFTDYPATAAAMTQSRTTGINSAYADIARQRVEQNRAANNAQASRQAEARIRRQLDERSGKQI
jgi:hypothetical protein